MKRSDFLSLFSGWNIDPIDVNFHKNENIIGRVAYWVKALGLELECSLLKGS